MNVSKLTFPNISDLVPTMRMSAVDKEHFSFPYARQTIDCILSLCEKGCELLVGVHMLNFGFVVPIMRNKRGLYIGELSDNDYNAFCRALGLTFRGDGFSSNTLLKLLSSNIPVKSTGQRVSYEEMRRFVKCRHVDEADKIYFKGWNDHKADGKIARNFDKTEFYCGKEVADYCRANNISSIWTDIKSDELTYKVPW